VLGRIAPAPREKFVEARGRVIGGPHTRGSPRRPELRWSRCRPTWGITRVS